MAEQGIRADRSGTLEMRRLARHCIANAHRYLSAQNVSDSNVHDARKEIKKSRSAVRLLRIAMGKARYRRENARLRDAGRALNTVRDARVLVKTLDSLRKIHPNLAADAACSTLSRQLHDFQRTARHQSRQSAPPIAAARRGLEQIRYSAGRWPVDRGGWELLGPAFRRIYGAGRHAARQARASSNDHQLHEWRKQVKYLVHALHFLKPLRPNRLSRDAKEAQRLADDLGEEHDLALLRASAVAHGRAGAMQMKVLLAAIDRGRRALRKRALVLGGRVYSQSPIATQKRLQRYWHRWSDCAK